MALKYLCVYMCVYIYIYVCVTVMATMYLVHRFGDGDSLCFFLQDVFKGDNGCISSGCKNFAGSFVRHWLSDIFHIFGTMITSDNLYIRIFHQLNLSWLHICYLCLVEMNINAYANSHLRRTC